MVVENFRKILFLLVAIGIVFVLYNLISNCLVISSQVGGASEPQVDRPIEAITSVSQILPESPVPPGTPTAAAQTQHHLEQPVAALPETLNAISDDSKMSLLSKLSPGSQKNDTGLLAEKSMNSTSGTDLPCKNNADCNTVYGDGVNQCLNNKCSCTFGTGSFCHLRPNYYKSLKQMTPEQIVQFKQNGKVEKMSLEDYRNWLSLWEHDQINLPAHHKQNFLKLHYPI